MYLFAGVQNGAYNLGIGTYTNKMEHNLYSIKLLYCIGMQLKYITLNIDTTDLINLHKRQDLLNRQEDITEEYRALTIKGRSLQQVIDPETPLLEDLAQMAVIAYNPPTRVYSSFGMNRPQIVGWALLVKHIVQVFDFLVSSAHPTLLYACVGSSELYSLKTFQTFSSTR